MERGVGSPPQAASRPDRAAAIDAPALTARRGREAGVRDGRVRIPPSEQGAPTGRAPGRDASGDRQEPSPAVIRGRTVSGQAGKRERLEDRALAALLSEPTIVLAATKAGV